MTLLPPPEIAATPLPTTHHGAPQVTDVKLSEPPPTFWTEILPDMGARFCVEVLKDRTGVPTFSWGGRAVTFKLTWMVWTEPEQLPVEQVTFTDVA